MTKHINDIINSMRMSGQYSIKGYQTRFSDAFPIKYSQEHYIAFILTKATFDGKIIGHEYAIYSVENCKAIETNSSQYCSITASMPPIENLGWSNNYMDPFRWRRLRSVLDHVIERYHLNTTLSDEEAKEYNEYLDEMSTNMTESYKAIFDYFKCAEL